MKREKLIPIADKKQFLEDHLFNELRWLLCASTEWSIQKKTCKNPTFHISVYTMDSAFLHARALFEFFTKKTSSNYYGYNEFQVNEIDSIYKRGESNWENALHNKLMHLQNRSEPEILKDVKDSNRNLNDMPLDFAKEVVRLWRDFISKLKDEELKNIAQEKLNEAIKESKLISNKYQADLIKW